MRSAAAAAAVAAALARERGGGITWGGRRVCVSNGGEKMSPDDVSTARGIWGYVRTKQMLDQVEGKVHTVRCCTMYEGLINRKERTLEYRGKSPILLRT